MGASDKPAMNGFRLMLDDEQEAVWKFIASVVKKHGGYHKYDIFDQLYSGDMQAHVWKDQEIKAAFITQILEYPRRRVCLLLFGGGTDLKNWKDSARAYFEMYARANGCHELEIVGRLGWGKIYPDTKTVWAIYRSEL